MSKTKETYQTGIHFTNSIHIMMGDRALKLTGLDIFNNRGMTKIYEDHALMTLFRLLEKPNPTKGMEEN